MSSGLYRSSLTCAPCPPHPTLTPTGPSIPLQRAGSESCRNGERSSQSPWSLRNTGALREGHVSGFPHMLTILRRLGGSWCKPLNYCPFFSFFNTNLVLSPQIFKQLLGDSESNTIFRIKFKIPQNSPQE